MGRGLQSLPTLAILTDLAFLISKRGQRRETLTFEGDCQVSTERLLSAKKRKNGLTTKRHRFFLFRFRAWGPFAFALGKLY